MGFVILTRNPSNRKLIAIVDGDEDNVAEFETEEAAIEAAHETTVCKAWGYQVLAIE